ncbi:hypothetical protein ACFLZH_02590 [Patescibacteria group bacterium]
MANIADPDKNLDEDKGGKGKETPFEALHPDVATRRKDVQQQSEGVVMYQSPEFNIINRLNEAILEAVDAGNIEEAQRLQKEKTSYDVSMVKNCKKANTATRKRFVKKQRAESADDQEILSNKRREKIDEYAPVVKNWIINTSEGAARGGFKLTKGFASSIGFVLKEAISISADAVKEIGDAVVHIVKTKRDKLDSNRSI